MMTAVRFSKYQLDREKCTLMIKGQALRLELICFLCYNIFWAVVSFVLFRYTKETTYEFKITWLLQQEFSYNKS
jgi:hypothetical protein